MISNCHFSFNFAEILQRLGVGLHAGRVQAALAPVDVRKTGEVMARYACNNLVIYGCSIIDGSVSLPGWSLFLARVESVQARLALGRNGIGASASATTSDGA